MHLDQSHNTIMKMLVNLWHQNWLEVRLNFTCICICTHLNKCYYSISKDMFFVIKQKEFKCLLWEVKVLLHCAIFSATCLAMVENVALQVAEVRCWGPVTLSNFLNNLSRNAPRNEKQEVCACALVKTAVKLWHKLLEGWYTVQWCNQLLQSVAKSRDEFYFVQRFAQQKHWLTSCWENCTV